MKQWTLSRVLAPSVIRRCFKVFQHPRCYHRVVTLKYLVRSAVVLVVIVAAAMLYPPLRLSALVLAGRSPHCPLSRAVDSLDEQKRQIDLKDEILRSSKLIASDDKYEHWQTPRGNFWIAKGSRYVLPFNLAEQQRQIYFNDTHTIKAGDVVLDCGANIGVFVREALHRGASKVVAIEPAPENIECLRRNFAREVQEGRVVVYPKGVWDKDDWLTLHVHEENSAADSFVMHSDKAHETEEKFPLTTIDKLVTELGLPGVDFIKMDIEGAEVKALEGGRQTIARYRPRLSVSVYHAADHPASVPAAVQSAWNGYRRECGPCAVTPDSRIRPDILYFHP
jgi:FkbM family methyltransferase